MQNDKPNRPRQRHQYGSIDGVVARPQKEHSQPLDNYRQAQVNPVNIPNVSPKLTDTQSPHQSGGQPPSMLNMTLPSTLSQVTSRQLPKTKKHRSFKSYAKRTALALLAILMVGGGYFGFSFYHSACKLTRNCNPFAVVTSALDQVNLKSEGDWVNVLVAGYDPADGDITTDTIMVVSVNKQTNQAIMLSIPRDTWVNDLPGFGHQKINASNDISSFNEPGYPKGGMGELEKQIHDKLGITTDYYALVNNNAYVDGVNAVGGIDINIQSVDPRGLYDPNVDKANGGPVKLTNGWHHLDGITALGLVKARGDSPYSYGFPNSDFDREAHARQVIMALKDKALSTGVLANPVKISQLLNAVGSNVQTDITLNDASGFYNLMKKINNTNIKSLSLQSINGQKLLTGQVIDGLDVEAPTAGVDNYSQIQTAVKRLYSTDPVFQEAATVVVLNGSNVDGLAQQEENTLNNEGFVVIQIGDPNNVYPNSMIIDQSKGKDPASLKALQKIFSTNTTTTTSTTTPTEATEAQHYYNADFVIILGQNWNNTTTQ